MSEKKKPISYEWLEEKAIDKTFWRYPPCKWEMRPIDAAEATAYRVEVKVLEILGRGVCPHGHKPGDTFIFDGDSLPEVVKSSAPSSALCLRAMERCISWIWSMGLMNEGSLDYGRGDQNSFMTLRNCPEIQNPVIFQFKRIEKLGQTSKASFNVGKGKK